MKRFFLLGIAVLSWVRPLSAQTQDTVAAGPVLVSEQSPNADKRSPGKIDSCLVVKYDEILAPEAIRLVNNLNRRLKKNGIRVVLEHPVVEPAQEDSSAVNQPPSQIGHDRDSTEPPDHENMDRETVSEMVFEADENGEIVPSPVVTKPCDIGWVVHIRHISSKHLLIAVDRGDAGSREDHEDMVREVHRIDPTETAWTMALLVESFIARFYETEKTQAPLGAGLAIIEPPAVGGAKQREPTPEATFPQLSDMGVGLAFYWHGALDSNRLMLGPQFFVQGLLAEKVIALIGVTWVGNGRYQYRVDEHESDSPMRQITVNHIPIDVLFGILMVRTSWLRLSAQVGFSAGLSVYQHTIENNVQRTYPLFDPRFQSRFQGVLRIYGPLTIYLAFGAAVVLNTELPHDLRDTKYTRDRFLPNFSAGMQIWL